MSITDDIIRVESGGDPNARASSSSATGLGQFVGGTWLGLIRKYRPDLAQGRSDSQLLALRTNPSLSREMVQNYANDNATALLNSGIQPSPGNLYLSHFAGPGTAINVLKADPSAPAGSVLGAGAVQANPFLRNMTIGQLRNWASSKVGGGTSALPVEAGVSPAAGMMPAQASAQLAQPFAQLAQPFAQSPPNSGQRQTSSAVPAINHPPDFITPPPMPQAPLQQLGPVQQQALPPTQLPAGLIRARLAALRGSLGQG